MRACEICGETESDTVRCFLCGRTVCYECSEWAHDEDDEACGDWVCVECETTEKTE